MSERWDRGFLNVALRWCRDMSRDPNTQVGAVLVGPDREVIGMGFNGFPMGIADDDRLNDRELKNRMVAHAERNAIWLAGRRGIATYGATLYMAATDDTGAVWGGAPCTQCSIAVIQSGIKEVVSAPIKTAPTKWADDLKFALALLSEAKIRYREVEPAKHGDFSTMEQWF